MNDFGDYYEFFGKVLTFSIITATLLFPFFNRMLTIKTGLWRETDLKKIQSKHLVSYEE